MLGKYRSVVRRTHRRAIAVVSVLRRARCLVADRLGRLGICACFLGGFGRCSEHIGSNCTARVSTWCRAGRNVHDCSSTCTENGGLEEGSSDERHESEVEAGQRDDWR